MPVDNKKSTILRIDAPAGRIDGVEVNGINIGHMYGKLGVSKFVLELDENQCVVIHMDFLSLSGRELTLPSSV